MNKLHHYWPALLLCGSFSAIAATPQYRLTLLDNVPGSAMAINNAGLVAGFRSDMGAGSRSFTWENGQFTLLPQDLGVVYGMSSAGHIAGTSQRRTNYNGYAFWTGGQVYHDGVLATMPDAINPDDLDRGLHAASARAVNSAGTTVLNVEKYDSRFTYMVSNNQVTILPLVETGNINDAGQVAGTATGAGSWGNEAVIYDHGNLIRLGRLPSQGYGPSFATDINEAGAVVGGSWYGDSSSGHYHSFLYENGKMVPLGNFTKNNSANAVNNAGAVVGATWSLQNPRAYLIANGEQYDLTTLTGNSAGWTITRAQDINDSGYIVGAACRNNGNDCVAALLSPVPEPGTWAMLLAGLGVVGWRRRVQG